MDALQLISYLGYGSVHADLDRFLLAAGVTKSPKKIEGLQWVEEKKLGLKLYFRLAEIFDEEFLAPRKSDGKFIFSQVEFHQPFADVLPYGLTWGTTHVDMQKAFGNPLKHSEAGGAIFSLFFKDGLLVDGYWEKNKTVFAFSLPEKTDAEEYGITLSA